VAPPVGGAHGSSKSVADASIRILLCDSKSRDFLPSPDSKRSVIRYPDFAAGARPIPSTTNVPIGSEVLTVSATPSPGLSAERERL